MKRRSLSCLLALSLLSCTADNTGYMPGGDGGDVDMAGGGCADGDRDGVTVCAGDCDDADPNNFPGNREICGDAKDNTCEGTAEEGCNGLGTFVANTGNDGNPGTQAQPLLTIAKGIANAVTIGGGAVHVAAGHYPEKVKLVEGISLLGGYQCGQAACTWARDATSTDAAYDTALLAPDTEGVLADKSISRATRIEGFRIVGRAAAGASTAALSLDGGVPTVANNRIQGGALMSGSGATAAVRIYASSDAQGALLTGNEISAGTSTDLSAGVQIQPRSGGGANAKVAALLSGNTILGGTGRNSYAVVSGSASAGVLLQANTIQAGTSSSDGGASWAIVTAGSTAIDGNRINADGARLGSCLSKTQWCGGVSSVSASAVLTNNVIAGIGADLSAGVFLQEAEAPTGEIVLNGNYVSGGGRANAGDGTTSAGVVTRIGQCLTCGFRGIMGRLRNNILDGGRNRTRVGVLEDATLGRMSRPELLENNFFTQPVTIGRLAVLYRSWDGTKSTDLMAIATVNQLVKPPAQGNLAGDPLIDGTFHLAAGSPCIDKGTATEAPARDIDGQKRPQGAAVDIGPDEAR